MRKIRKSIQPHSIVNKQGWCRGFWPPYRTDDFFFKEISYDDIFRRVKGQVEGGMYLRVYRVGQNDNCEIPKFYENNKKTNEWLRNELTSYPYLRQRHVDNILLQLIGDLLLAPTRYDRQQFKDALDRILEAPKGAKDAKKSDIPPGLSLIALCEYVHLITVYLREKYIDKFVNEAIDKKDIGELENVDPRLIPIAEKGFIEELINGPVMLTKRMIAANFKLKSPGALDQYMLRTEGRKTWKDKKNTVPTTLPLRVKTTRKR